MCVWIDDVKIVALWSARDSSLVRVLLGMHGIPIADYGPWDIVDIEGTFLLSHHFERWIKSDLHLV